MAVAMDFRSRTPPSQPHREIDEAAAQRAESGDEEADESDLGNHADDPML
jgi:hypothetical protein